MRIHWLDTVLFLWIKHAGLHWYGRQFWKVWRVFSTQKSSHPPLSIHKSWGGQIVQKFAYRDFSHSVLWIFSLIPVVDPWWLIDKTMYISLRGWCVRLNCGEWKQICGLEASYETLAPIWSLKQPAAEKQELQMASSSLKSWIIKHSIVWKPQSATIFSNHQVKDKISQNCSDKN